MNFSVQQTLHSFGTSARNLSLYRIIFCLYVVFFTGIPSFGWINEDLDYFFHPPAISLAGLLDGFPSRSFFMAVSFINLVSFFLMFWGYRTVVSSVVFSCSYIVGANFMYSMGKIDHTLLLFLTPVFMGLAGWGKYYSVDQWQKKPQLMKSPEGQPHRRALLMALFALVIGFSFFTSGIAKGIGGWWKPGLEAVRYHLYYNYFVWHRVNYLAGYALLIDSHFFWKLMDYFTLFFEITFLAGALHVRVFRYYLAAAVVFHCMVLLLFNINFSNNLIVYLAFVDWQKIRLYFRNKMPWLLQKPLLKNGFKLSGLLLVFYIVSLLRDPLRIFHHSILEMICGFFPVLNLWQIVVFSTAFIFFLVVVYVHFHKTPGPAT